MSDEEITSIFCTPCGIAIGASGCPSCKLGLQTTQRRTQQIAIARDSEKILRALLIDLDRLGTVQAIALAARGRVIVESLRRWSVVVPEQEERSRQLQSAADWRVGADGYLADVRALGRGNR